MFSTFLFRCKFFLLTAIACGSLSIGIAQQTPEKKIENSIKILQEYGKLDEAIPQELLKISEGMVIIPKMINAGFVIGGKRGRGIALVKNDDGSWGDPLFVTLTGGSVGFQIGVQSVDLILIFKHKNTLLEMGNGTFTLGGDISATAGPVGRNSSASTDYKMEAEVYSYSKSKGLFAGISLSGSSIAVDKKFNPSFYGKPLTPDEILRAHTPGNSLIADLWEALGELNPDRGERQVQTTSYQVFPRRE